MNLLNKTAPWMTASLLAAASVFGQNNSKCPPPQKSFEQGHEMNQNQMMAGYNAPARIDVRGAWDFYATGAFTYWQPIQDNMEVAITDSISATNLAASAGIENGHVVNMDFDFKPGFQVGLGMNFDHDNWDGYAQYTWFRGTDRHSTSRDNPAAGCLFATRGHPSLIAGNVYQSAHETWKLHMDFVDTELARSYYVGTHFSLRPAFGARGAWIRQRAHTTYQNVSFNTNVNGVAAVPGTLDVVQTQQSWAVGPRVGLYGNWMIGQGFRLFGNGFADILYTRYTKANVSSSWKPVTGTQEIFNTRQTDLSSVKTHLDLEMGFGWGSYFDNNNWHVDLTAGYGFQVFFDQNMFRNFYSTNSLGATTAPNGNLYVQGLTASARFDF